MIDVMIITHNEAVNLPWCLRSLRGWTNRVFVIDSGSTDGTQEISKGFGAEVVHHDWPGYAHQKNWGLETLPFESPWILLLDADESVSEHLRRRLTELASLLPASVRENGFFVNRLTYFMGRPIRHCGYFPNYNLRFLKQGMGRFEDRPVHEHVVIDDPVGYIREVMLHDDRRGLEHYFAKHNRYSTLEALALHQEITGDDAGREAANISAQTRRRRWVKRWIMPRVPLPGLWRFIYMYVMRLGILDGMIGLSFCRFIAMYDKMVSMKLKDLKRTAATHATAAPIQGLATAEGSDTVTPDRAHRPAAVTSAATAEPTQMRPESSPWSFKEKVGRAVWMVIGKPVFRVSFHNWYRFRATILRRFGARIGTGVAIRPSVNIEVPWHLDIDDDATVGDHAILYSLGQIRIGKRSIVSQYAHLCAGTHDYTDHTFKLLRTPITIGDDVWIGADAFVGPGVLVGDLSVLGARSSTYKSLDPRTVFVGNPARPIKERVLE